MQALVAVIGMDAREEVHWELLDRGEMHLFRKNIPESYGTVKEAT
jgi:hypothetical protein